MGVIEEWSLTRVKSRRFTGWASARAGRRKIARHLKVGRKSVRKYLGHPAAKPASRKRGSKLDPYREAIGLLLEEDAGASAVVIAQPIRKQGYEGGITILRDHLRAVRPRPRTRAFVRVESAAGERFEVDWGHFGALVYEGEKQSSTPSCSWTATAGGFTWSSPTARVSKPSPAATFTPSATWAGSGAGAKVHVVLPPSIPTVHGPFQGRLSRSRTHAASDRRSRRSGFIAERQFSAFRQRL